VFAHLPLIVGADRRKLSKRRDRVSVQQFRSEGYLPEAMVNYLALLGWSLDDHTELFSLADLERLFSLERVSRNPAAFDTKKLDALNGHYLRQLSGPGARSDGAGSDGTGSVAGVPDGGGAGGSSSVATRSSSTRRPRPRS
jgi:glutamyl/glutaminyl-tRNA synthetase